MKKMLYQKQQQPTLSNHIDHKMYWYELSPVIASLGYWSTFINYQVEYYFRIRRKVKNLISSFALRNFGAASVKISLLEG